VTGKNGRRAILPKAAIKSRSAHYLNRTKLWFIDPDSEIGRFCTMRKRPATEINGMHIRGLGDELLHALDEFRRSEPDLPSRPKAACRLLQQALARQDEEASDARREVAA
jgi:hypothetical protein